MDTPLLKAWLYDFSCYSKTGKLITLMRGNWFKMKKKLEEDNGDEIEVGQEESFSDQDSGIPTMLEV